MVKFVHIADLHLGCKPFNLDKRELDFWLNFERVLKFCDDNLNEKDFCIIAGDVFDNRNLNAQILYNFIKLISGKRYKFYVISGNHDRQTRDTMSWLEYLGKQGYINYINSNKATHGDIVIYGFENYKKLQMFNQPFERGKYNILMLHEGINGQMEFVTGIDENEINKLNFSYVALGHYHMQYKINNIHNPGSIERCALNEAGGGYFLVDIDNKTEQFYDLPKRLVEHVVLDITSITEEKNIEPVILDKIKSINKESIIELTLTGKTKLIVNCQIIADKLNQSWFYVKIRNHSTNGDIDLPTEYGNDKFEAQILGQHVDSQDVSRILELKKIINLNPSVEEIREILKK